MQVDLLVTGGDGLLGSAVASICPDAIFLTRRDADLRDLSQVRALFERLRPSRVLHLAARVGGVKANATLNADLFTENVQINTNVLNAAQEFGAARLISLLSSCSFQLYSDRASTEDDLHAGLPFEGNVGYSYAKRMLDVQTRLLWQQHGCRFSTVAPVTMYGPRDNFDLESGHVIGALIHKCLLAKERGEPLQVWGGGEAVRQFVYVEDVARLLLQSLDSDHGPETVIIAPDEGTTIRALAGLIAKAAGFKGSLLFDSTKPEGVLVKRLKSKRFATLFQDFSFTNLDIGLAKTVAWFLKSATTPSIHEKSFASN